MNIICFKFNYKVMPIRIIALIFSFIFSMNLFAQETEHVKIESFLDKKSYRIGDSIKIALSVTVKDKYHINSYESDDPNTIVTEIKLNNDLISNSNIYFPKDELYKFEFSENKIRVYEGKIFIGISGVISGTAKDGENKISFSFKYQACDNAACYAPKTVEISKPVIINSNAKPELINADVFKNINFLDQKKSKETESVKTEQTKTVKNQDEQKVSNLIQEKGIIIALIIIFLWGLALNLTPCIYPLIPITISYFGAQASGSKAKSIMMGVFYALGMAVTYSALGVVSALAGGMIGSALQNPIVIIGIALIFLVLATSMFGLWEIRVPQSLALAGNKNRSGLLGSLFMGLMVGFIAAPCIGPVVLSLVVHVGEQAAKFNSSLAAASYGFLLFFVLSMGLGLPYIFLAAFSNSLSKLPRSGEWMEGVKIIFGLILIGLAIYTVNPLLPSPVNKYTLPIFLILGGIYLFLFVKKGNNSKMFRNIRITIAVLSIIIGIWKLFPKDDSNSVKWTLVKEYYSLEKSMSAEKKLTIIDFYADWCAQCKELDEYTYIDKDVVEASKDFNNIKVDLTKGNDTVSTKFNIKGLPVVIFINSKGEELKELRVTGFLEPQEFIKKIKALKESDKK
jgi:thioredoxin:protein disulfide reductase